MAFAPPRTTGLTWEDLQRLPDDGNRYEVIDGVLYVTAAPYLRHQRVVLAVLVALWHYAREHGGQPYGAPTGVVFSPVDGVEPDVVYVGPDRLGIQIPAWLAGAPTLVVEVSSPSTRRNDLGVKRDLYERSGVPEYWFADLDRDELLAFRRLGEAGGYTDPVVFGGTDVVMSPTLPGFAVRVSELLVP